ncbi:PilZ domain-containing protein [Deltaproteobacteria bacterium]|nr:PilZ domain-containing protein [Deltaproteobacteria bacterium]
MTEFVEKRKFRRFEMPGGEVRHKRIMSPVLLQHFSKPYPVLNMGVGGLAVVCKEGFRNGEALIIQLTAPNENPLNLRSTVRWQGPIALSTDIIAGLEFTEFGNNRDLNSPETLGVLRRLYARYIKE